MTQLKTHGMVQQFGLAALVGLVLYSAPAMVMLAAMGLVAWIMWLAFTSSNPLHLARVLVLLCGAEILTRRSGVPFPWEGWKYVAVAAMATFSLRGIGRVQPSVPLAVYAVCLVPGAVITIGTLGAFAARERLSFALSGPLLVIAAVSFFRRYMATIEGAHQILWWGVLSVVPVAMTTLLAVSSTPGLQFFDDSNKAASGGYGPNQVSSVLGFGVVCCFLLLVSTSTVRDRILIAGVGVWFAAQALLTFSRGGLWSALLAILIGLLFSARNPGDAAKFALQAGLVAVLMLTFLLPRLDAFTGGLLGVRQADTNATHRDQLFRDEIRQWGTSPIFGVGAGQVESHRAPGLIQAAAHTEPSRVLAEHGLIGIAGFVALMVLAVRALRSATEAFGRLWCTVLIAWPLAVMSFADMRNTVVGLAFGLAMLRVEDHPMPVRRMPGASGGRRSLRSTDPADRGLAP